MAKGVEVERIVAQNMTPTVGRSKIRNSEIVLMSHILYIIGNSQCVPYTKCIITSIIIRAGGERGEGE